MKKRTLIRSLMMAAFVLIVIPIFSSCSKKAELNDEKTLLIWHWMTDRDETFQTLAGQYKDQTGIDVRFELYAPSDVYTYKVRAAAQTNTLPDIYGILGESRDISKFVNAGYVPDMAPYLDANNGEWRNVFFKEALATNEFGKDNPFKLKPGTYGIPIDVTNIQMLYNKDIFKKAGLDPDNPPETWEEFLDAGEKIKEAGYSVFVGGFAEIWLINSIASCFAINLMGFEKFENTLKGDVPYTDPDWIKIFSLFDEMSRKDFYISGIVSMVNKQGERYFAREEAAITYNGSWSVNVYSGMNPELNYGTMLPPKLKADNPVMIQGGAGSSFFINSRSDKIDVAVDFLKWLTDRKQQLYLAEKTNNLPSNKYTFDEGSKGILQEFVDDMDKMFHPQTMRYSEHPRVLEMMGKGIQAIIIGKKTPEELAREVQELKQNLM
ncbi:MAG: extracellular solute-binding protein [Candidatus Aureabacteria bacterium]|nr:extracellular solute-binding protein [Candidatus Auribacterota bacterium]